MSSGSFWRTESGAEGSKLPEVSNPGSGKGAREGQMGRTGYSQGHVQDLIGLWLPDPSEQLLKAGHEGNTSTYEQGAVE